MQHLVDRYPAPAFSVRTDADLTIDAWNHAAEVALGWTAAEAIGQPANERVVPAIASVRRRKLELLRRRDWWTGSATLLHRDGRPITFRGMCWSVLDQGERHYVTVLHQQQLMHYSDPDGRPQIAQISDRRNLSQIASPSFADLAYMPESVSDNGVPLVQASALVNAAAEDLAARHRRKFGRKLRRARIAAGQTQEQYAALVGELAGTHTTQRDISRWESGLHSPRVGPIALALALNKPPDYFDRVADEDDDD
jgi:PAS domain S-box-containing protein